MVVGHISRPSISSASSRERRAAGEGTPGDAASSSTGRTTLPRQNSGMDLATQLAMRLKHWTQHAEHQVRGVLGVGGLAPAHHLRVGMAVDRSHCCGEPRWAHGTVLLL